MTTTTVHVMDIVRHGRQFIIPEGITYDEAIAQLQRRKQYEEETVVIKEVVDCIIWDGAVAFQKAMAKQFGYSTAEPIPGFFGDKPPAMLSVATGPFNSVLVPWGRFSLPGISGYVQTGYEEKSDLTVFVMVAEVKRKNEQAIRALAAEVRRIAQDESIYKGKAFGLKLRDDDGDRITLPEVKFMDLSKVKEGEIVFASEVEKSISTNLFTPIEKTDECREAGIPLKRGILLSGPYGTGKTLVTYVTAAKCENNGWTFLHCQKADELADMVRFAHKFQPAVIFCEDVDRVTYGERDTDMDDLLNIVDGIESKNTELMVVLTTNHVENINKAMLRPGRLDAVVNVLPPDAQAVERLIRLYGRDLIDAKANLRKAGQLLAGNIPAVIRECVERSKLASIKNESDSITEEDILDAAESMKNQLQLLNGKTGVAADHERISKIVGDAFIKQFDMVSKNGNGKN